MAKILTCGSLQQKCSLLTHKQQLYFGIKWKRRCCCVKFWLNNCLPTSCSKFIGESMLYKCYVSVGYCTFGKYYLCLVAICNVWQVDKSYDIQSGPSQCNLLLNQRGPSQWPLSAGAVAMAGYLWLPELQTLCKSYLIYNEFSWCLNCVQPFLNPFRHYISAQKYIRAGAYYL